MIFLYSQEDSPVKGRLLGCLRIHWAVVSVIRSTPSVFEIN